MKLLLEHTENGRNFQNSCIVISILIEIAILISNGGLTV